MAAKWKNKVFIWAANVYGHKTQAAPEEMPQAITKNSGASGDVLELRVGSKTGSQSIENP